LATADASRVADSPELARAALAAEWEARGPRNTSEVLDFYRHSEHLEGDLDAFHSDPERQKWTAALVHVVSQCSGKVVVDIGCGAGHDLRALAAQTDLTSGDMTLIGVEPNIALGQRLRNDGFVIVEDVADAPIETADVISCFDVLEHVVDPETWLASIATRARIGAVLLETCATFDIGTPLHLKANRGWKPGHCLELHGWEQIAAQGRLRVWERMAETNRISTSLMLITSRTVSLPTYRSIISLLVADPTNARGWRRYDGAESGLLRARNVVASRWWADTADDVFLMVDDDIQFEPEHAEHLVDMCRAGHDIIAGAYSVRDGGHLAVRALDGDSGEIAFGAGLPPHEMRHMSTGFFAVHRKVLDALIPTLPLCHANMIWSFWPLFDFRVIEDEAAGGWNHLSEDYNFCQMAIDAGFKVWLDPTVNLKHLGIVPISVSNMASIPEVIKNA
jgi:SAM-dependent methyltransferase